MNSHRHRFIYHIVFSVYGLIHLYAGESRNQNYYDGNLLMPETVSDQHQSQLPVATLKIPHKVPHNSIYYSLYGGI